MKFFTSLLVLIAFWLGTDSAGARPEYAKKELKPCSYCHVSGTPGIRDAKTGQVTPATRNERGRWYGSHGLSFEGYKPAPAAKQALPHFRPLWRTSLKEAVRKAALADLAGDGKPRLITLNEDGQKAGSALLIVFKWNGKGWDEEARTVYAGKAARMFVGNVTGSGRNAIVTGDSVFTYEGAKLILHPLNRPFDLIGGVRLKDGSARLLTATARNELKTYQVQLNASGASMADAGGMEALPQEQLQWYDLHVTPELEAMLGKEAEGGLVALWKLPEANQTIFYRIRTNPNYEVGSETAGSRKPKYTLKGEAFHLVFGFLDGAELWASPPMASMPSDVTVFPGKGEFSPGFLVLEKESGSSKTCALTFYALEMVRQ